MRKIAVSSNTCWSVFNFRLKLLCCLKSEFQVEVIAPKDKYSEQLRARGFVVHDIPMVSSGLSPLRDIITLVSYIRLIRKIKPDYYLGFTAKPNIYGGGVAALLGCQVVNNIAGLGRVFAGEGLLKNVLLFMYRIGLRKSRHVFFQNIDDLSEFKRNKTLSACSSFSVLPGSGVDVNKFKPDFRKSALRPVGFVKSSEFVFLFSSRLLLEKGIIEYINAARLIKSRHPCVRFDVLGGHGDVQQNIVVHALETASRDGIVNYLGVTDDVLGVLKTAHCFVLPSYYREGVPRSLLEAGSCGLPLITTDSIGCRETVIDGYNGYLIPPNDERALYCAMLKMITLDELARNAMGVASRNYMLKKFSEDIVLQEYLNILNVHKTHIY